MTRDGENGFRRQMKNRSLISIFFGILILFGSLIGKETESAGTIIACRSDSALLRFAVTQLGDMLGQRTSLVPLTQVTNAISLAATCSEAEAESLGLRLDPSVRKEGFQIARRRRTLCILGRDESGAMYGLLDVAEQARLGGGLEGVREKISNPRFAFRAIKFNLPWSPYRSGPATDLHMDTCRDLNFWRRFLDMMAVNRFNVLSLWNLHPFPYLIRPKNFPEACPWSDKEMESWRQFWRSLFRLAKERGIETYLVNWNIVVPPEFARARGVKETGDSSPIVRRYMRECVTQVINEYEDLTGLGVTLADWMGDLKPKEAEDYVAETFAAGIKQAARPVKFLHRATLTGDPLEMRRLIDDAALPDPVWVEIKFNWSHGHSTPRLAITHDDDSGKVDNRYWTPAPTNYKIAWMVRNEDFFILRWGEPGFIREHIAQNGHDYVGGYFVGSEGYIPAKDYSHKPSQHKTWDYAFEKQWMFYSLWGRLLYDPATPDAVFEAELERRYGDGLGRDMLRAYTLASRMPLKLASFYRATWDFTLYSEGFLAAVKSNGESGLSPFISIDELIDHKTLDPTFLSIRDFVSNPQEGFVTPLHLAQDLEADGSEVLRLVSSLRPKAGSSSGALECELDDLETWAYLSLYFGDKLRAGTALETFRRFGQIEEKKRAISLLEGAATHWQKVSDITGRHYRETPHVHGDGFSWEKYRPLVLRDIEIARRAVPR
jgi:hypothetical protein